MSQPRDDRQDDLFRPALEEIINLRHPLVQGSRWRLIGVFWIARPVERVEVWLVPRTAIQPWEWPAAPLLSVFPCFMATLGSSSSARRN